MPPRAKLWPWRKTEPWRACSPQGIMGRYLPRAGTGGEACGQADVLRTFVGHPLPEEIPPIAMQRRLTFRYTGNLPYASSCWNSTFSRTAMLLGIRPTNDFAFKKTFDTPENRRALISLLNAILRPAEPIVKVRLI